tara:strand:- start:123 stop:311 length:189 start_codon:yes stop_codon:yes gene_type:complete
MKLLIASPVLIHGCPIEPGQLVIVDDMIGEELSANGSAVKLSEGELGVFFVPMNTSTEHEFG